MFLKHYETSRYLIEILLTNKSELVSFDQCFEFNIPKILPKWFKLRDDRIFSKIKLERFDNTVVRITCKGQIKFSELKNILPTVFDIKKIKKLNEQNFVENNRTKLIEMTQGIIGKEKAESLLNKKI
jgi:hypothetical protein